MPIQPRRVALIVALGIATATLPARAADDAAATSAREHYQKGTAYYDLGKYTDAIKEFEAAYEAKNDPALLFNLAQSHRLAGNADQALHFYRTYLRRMPKAPNRAEIEGRITALEQQVAQKNGAGAATPPPIAPPIAPPMGTAPPPETAQPPQGPSGAVVPVTPSPAGTAPGPVTPPPQGASATIVAQPGTPATSPADHARNLKVAGIATAGVGGLLVIIGAIEGARAAAAASEVNKATTFDPDVEKRGISAQHWRNGLLVVGILAAAAGGGLYYYGVRTERAATTQVAVAPVATPHGVGALLRVTF